ncbi:MAG: Uma2 family endonuclease [Jatrophihabitans sp.]
MTAMTAVHVGRPFTKTDLETMPDDGRRYELIDGVLIVSPSPIPLHQRVIKRLSRLLDGACPRDLRGFHGAARRGPRR